MPNTLPHDFPRPVVLKLRSGMHNGQQQLWAPFSHGGKTYKLVISYVPRSGITCQPGESWEVSPQMSPNGHIVFCTPVQKLLTAAGVHPIFGLFPRYREKEFQISLEMEMGRRSCKGGWAKRGRLSHVQVKNGLLIIELNEALHIPDDEDAELVGPGKEVLEIPLVGSFWRESQHERTLTWGDSTEQASYMLRFHENVWYSDQYLSDNDDTEVYFDEGAYEDYRELREELYWERLEED